MSDHNLRILVRNLRKEEEERIKYKNRSSSWKTIFKHHPLKSEHNYDLFRNMVHCMDKWGGSENPIPMLRSAYTWEVLFKISKNSLEDCEIFYEIAKNTVLYNKNLLLDKTTHNWFKKALTALYLSSPNAPENLNYLSDLNQEQKETCLSLAFQYFGLDAMENYEKLKTEFKLDKFNEKLVFWYWEAAPKAINLIGDIIDNLGEKQSFNYDLEYLADKFKPKYLLTSRSEEINKKFVPLSNIIVKTERYVAKSEKLYCVINEEADKIELKKIYDLFCCQSLIKQLEIKAKEKGQTIILRGEIREPDFAGFLGEFKFESVDEIFKNYPLIQQTKKSMEEFIEINKIKSNNKNYWDEVQAIFLSQVLELDLDKKPNEQKKLKI